MHGLHELILLTNKMAEGVNQGVYWWQETAFNVIRL